MLPGQKAPSAIRCIKTSVAYFLAASGFFLGQKAPSAIRCIKTNLILMTLRALEDWSEST